MSDVLSKPSAMADPLHITGRRLPGWTPAASAVASVAVAAGIGAGFGLASKLQWGLIAVLLFVGAQYILAVTVEGRRQAKDRLATSLVWAAFVLAVLPLFGLIYYTVSRGIKVINGTFLTHSMAGVLATDTDGGLYHALIGAGLFVLTVWILVLDMPYTGFAGSLALTILMIPTVVRSTEEMLKLVPNELREASLALGIPKWLTIVRVVIPTAIGGITTGIMLAVARVTGETAPVLLLVFTSAVINTNPFSNPQSNLPVFIYQEFNLGTNASQADAWGGALVLIVLVMLLNLVARGIARWKAPKASR